jgi:hypothetical protein
MLFLELIGPYSVRIYCFKLYTGKILGFLVSFFYQVSQVLVGLLS